MAGQVLKDAKSFTIGRIATGRNGVQTINAAKGFAKWSYDPKTNKTKYAKVFTVGMGNLLTILL